MHGWLIGFFAVLTFVYWKLGHVTCPAPLPTTGKFSKCPPMKKINLIPSQNNFKSQNSFFQICTIVSRILLTNRLRWHFFVKNDQNLLKNAVLAQKMGHNSVKIQNFQNPKHNFVACTLGSLYTKNQVIWSIFEEV